ncbi:efflux transporter outer membrane subunit [Rhodoferax sp. GW822-FHT02A01]|uniref:efflux transporter outer membrane subunit n=1 Tax=Rhodoferax sp. GW822-FHT02A01 TaxID=3141537 RepID=UPI00315D69A2
MKSSPSLAFPFKAASLAIVAATLAACGSMAPDYQRPAAPVPAQFPAAAGTAGAAAADTPWQDFFADERLQKLIRIALENNRDLRVALLNVEQARATVDVRKADRWPTVNAGLSLTRGTTTTGAVTSSYSAGLLVTSYEVDLFDRLRSQSDAAFAQYLASTEAGKAAQISLVGAVANAYFALQADTALLELSQQTTKTREESFKLTRLRFDNGASSQLDLSQAQSLLEAARVSLAQTTRQRMLDENALNLLLGQAAPSELVAGSAQLTTPLPELPTGVPSEVLLRRPDVVQAEQLLLAANANIGAARAAFFPKILLTASAGSVSSELQDLFKDGTFAWSFVPQLLLPIFDAGRNEANLTVAKTARDIAVAQYEKAIQSAFREVADALAGRATLGDQLKSQQAQTLAETERTRLTELRYKNGASSYLEVLDAQRSLFASQQAELQLRLQVLQNQATLYRVLGGGWSAAAKS